MAIDQGRPDGRYPRTRAGRRSGSGADYSVVNRPTEETAKAAESLQATLVELIDLSLQAKQAHWNLVGPSFGPIHLFLDELTDQYRDWYDEVAERLAAIGVSADGRIATVSAGTPLEPLPAGQLRDQDPIGAHDLVSQDLLASIGLGLDEQRWMLHDQRS
jgi:starvation-inducible DNA-binding protein